MAPSWEAFEAWKNSKHDMPTVENVWEAAWLAAKKHYLDEAVKVVNEIPSVCWKNCANRRHYAEAIERLGEDGE